MFKRTSFYCFAALCCIAFQQSAQAQLEISSHSIDSGGGTSVGAGFSVQGIIGQHDANNESSGGGFSVTGGSQTQDSILLGDLNGDGLVNLLDVAPFVDAISSTTFIEEADINQDGMVNRAILKRSECETSTDK